MDIARKLNQALTIYRKSGNDQYGKPSVSAPEVYDCRCADVNELIYTNTGEELYAKALIICEETFEEGDLVVLGDQSGESDPVAAGAQEIKRAAYIPNLRASQYIRIYHV